MKVDLDEEQLLREFDAKIAAAPAGTVEGEYLAAAPSWGETLREFEAAETVHQGLVPAWQIAPKDKEGAQNALGEILDRWAPGGADKIANAGPYVRLGYHVLKTLVVNFDFKHMRFKPIQERQEQEPFKDGGDAAKEQETDNADHQS